MKHLRKFVAPEFIFGQGASQLVGRYALNFDAERPMLVTDYGVTQAGWTDKIKSILNSVGLEPIVFDSISPNPRDTEVMEGAEIFRENNCDVIIALGGGSPMDAAKAIGVVVTNSVHVLEFEGVDKVASPGPPLICLPTTAGTAADVSQFSIINDTTNKKKIAIISKTMIPDAALIDPELCTTMDSYLTACTGLDALVHSIEAIVSTANSPIMDIHAFKSISLIFENLTLAIENPNNIEYRTNLSLASLEAGLAFSNASLGAVHAMAHSLGGYLDLPHGECNAILLDKVIQYNFEYASDRYKEIAKIIGIDTKSIPNKDLLSLLLQRINELKHNAGVMNGFGSKGLTSSDIPKLAHNALKDPCMLTNPYQPQQSDIEEIYEQSI